MLMKNTSETVCIVKLKQGASQYFVVLPQEVVEIDDKFAMPRRDDGGGRRDSVIEEIAPQMKPADEEGLAKWAAEPSKQPQNKGTFIPSVDALVKLGTPHGVAVKMVQQALASAAESIKAHEATELLKAKAHVKEPKNKPEKV